MHFKVWRVTRPSTLQLILAPFLIGTIVGTKQGKWHLGWFVICFIGVIFLHFAANAVNEWFDFVSGADSLTAKLPDNHITTPGVLLSGDCSVNELRNLVILTLSIAAVCGFALMLGRSFIVGLIFLGGGLLAYYYTAPPLALAYRGHGLGEIAVFMGYGLLPAIVAYNTLAPGNIDWQLFVLSTPFGFLAVALLMEHNYLHWKADKLAGKRTPIVVFGHTVSWLILGSSITGCYIALIINVWLGFLSPWVLLLLLTFYPMFYSWFRLRSSDVISNYITSIQFTSQTHFLMIIFVIMALLTLK